MHAGELSTPALNQTLDVVQSAASQQETVHDKPENVAYEQLLAEKILGRVIAAFRKIPGVEVQLGNLITEPRFHDAPSTQVVEIITAAALELPSIQKIVGKERDRFRKVIERAGAMSEDTVRQYATDPYVVTHKNGHPEGDMHFGLVESELGRGGFGYVEKVLFEGGRTLARKVFDPNRRVVSNIPKQRERFMGEYRVQQQLGDIVPRPEFAEGFDDPSATPSFAMEFLDGSSIAQLLAAINRDVEKGVARPERWVLLLYAGIAQSVFEVHTLHGAHDTTADSIAFIAGNSTAVTMQEPKRGLVHRDLKPQNVQLTSGGIVKIFDFGVARFDDAERDHTMTATGEVFGTPLYMAPELYDGGDNIKNASPASDVYALGQMLFESLTGRHAFAHASKDQVKLLRAHQEEFPNFDQVREGPIRILLESIFAKNAKARPTMAQVAHTLLDEFLRDATEDEKRQFADFLNVSVTERRIPLPPELERCLDAAYLPTVTDIASASDAESGDLVPASSDSIFPEALSFSQRLLESVPNPSQSLLVASPGNITYEVDKKTGKPRRISPARRVARTIAHNRWAQSLAALSMLGGTIAVTKSQFVDHSAETVPVAPFVANNDSKEEPKEQPLPHIPSLLRDLTPAEIADGAPAFGVLREGGKIEKVYAFGKVIDGANLYQLAPAEDHPDQNMGIALGYMSDADLAEGIFGMPRKDLETIAPAQKLKDISGALGHQNKYGSAFQGRVTEGRELQIYHADDSYLIMVQGICDVLGGNASSRPMAFTTEEFAPHLSHLQSGADFSGSYPDPGAMKYAVYSGAQHLKKLPPSDQMRSLSNEPDFLHVPVGENSGVDARLRKLARGVGRYIEDPTRVIQQNNHNKQSVSTIVKPDLSTNNSPQPPPQSP